MKKPIDNPRRPARPARRFSAMKRPVGRPDAVATPAEDDVIGDDEGIEAVAEHAPATADPVPAAPESPAPAPPKPASPAPFLKSTAPAVPGPAPAARSGDEARVAKVMSRAGLCSRREAEAWILAGRVAVNGTPIESPALNIGPSDEIAVDGYPIDKPEHTRLFMFHKTRGLVTTARDPEGRPTIFDALPDELPRLMTIGRLDINTEGLLLLTNDGGLARLLELPSTGWLRRYRVRANGRVDQTQLDALAKGVTVEGVDYAGIDAKLDRIQGANLWLTLGLREGKNREVKRVLEHLGLAVTRLIRISFGPFQLGDLAENAVEEVRTRVLRDQLGSALAKQAGLDFRVEEPEPRPAPSAEPEPRRKTSRSATADRKGRAVAIERITTPGRRAPERDASGPPGRRPAAASGDRTRPPRSGQRADERPTAPAERPARPARTLRQADAAAFRREQDPRPARAPAGERGTREGRPGERSPRTGTSAPRSENTRRPGRTRDAERPRTGRNKDEGSSRPPSRAAPGRAPERPARSGGAGFGDKPGRSGKPGPRREGAPARTGGRPPERGAPRPDRPGGKPSGGGRGRPRN